MGSPPTSRGGSRSTRSTAPFQYLDRTTFHPTFLYELLWDFAAAAVLVFVIERRFRPRPPGVFAAYIALYCVGRFVEELLRDRPGAPDRRAAAQRVGLADRDRRRHRLVRPLAAHGRPPGRGGPEGAARRARWPSRTGSASDRPARFDRVTSVVRDLELDLDAFEGPFDLLLTLILKEQLEPAEIDIASIVVAFVQRLTERDEIDLDACGEFLVLIAALLEIKARQLFPEEGAELAELEPEEAAEELARRLAEYRRMKEAAVWLRERLQAERERYFRLGPAPLAPRAERRLAQQDPEALATALRGLAVPPPKVSLSHMALRFPPVAQFLERFRAVLRRRRVFDFDGEVSGLSRVEQAVAFLALLELRKAGEIALAQAAPFAPIRVSRAEAERTQAWTVRSA